METFSTLLVICAGFHRSLVNSPQKGQGRGALMFSLICAWINGWVNNGEAGDMRRHRAHYDVTNKDPIYFYALLRFTKMTSSWFSLHCMAFTSLLMVMFPNNVPWKMILRLDMYADYILFRDPVSIIIFLSYRYMCMQSQFYADFHSDFF